MEKQEMENGNYKILFFMWQSEINVPFHFPFPAFPHAL